MEPLNIYMANKGAFNYEQYYSSILQNTLNVDVAIWMKHILYHINQPKFIGGLVGHHMHIFDVSRSELSSLLHVHFIRIV